MVGFLLFSALSLGAVFFPFVLSFRYAMENNSPFLLVAAGYAGLPCMLLVIWIIESIEGKRQRNKATNNRSVVRHTFFAKGKRKEIFVRNAIRD
jgi:hypothetical protein